MSSIAILLALLTMAVVLGVALVARLRVAAHPDEWLLQIRDGKLLQAGVGIVVWRRPGEMVTRFTSTMQRVRFDVEVLSRDQVTVRVEGFILWSVDGRGDRPFLAFRKLGINNLERNQPDLQSRQHLLTTPQHRAFRQLLVAALQRRAASVTFYDALSHQDQLVEGLRKELISVEQEMGILVERVELLRVRPVDPELLTRLSSEVEETTRRQAAEIAIDAAEQIKNRQIASDARVAQRESEVRQQVRDRDMALRTKEIQHQHDVSMQQVRLEQQEALAREENAAELAKAARIREEDAFVVRLDQLRREAEAHRDATLAQVSAEEAKSEAIRVHERVRFATEQIGSALAQLPLKDARWVSIGEQSPMTGLAGLFTGALEIARTASVEADGHPQHFRGDSNSD